MIGLLNCPILTTWQVNWWKVGNYQTNHNRGNCYVNDNKGKTSIKKYVVIIIVRILFEDGSN